MPTTCWGVQQHHRALPASAPRSARAWGALLSAHETWEKPEHSRESASGAALEPEGSCDRSCPGDGCCSCPGCGLVFKPAGSSTTGTVWCHRTTQAVAFPSLNGWQGPLEVSAPAQVEVAFMVKAQTPPKRRQVMKWPLIGFTPALNFRDTGVGPGVQLVWLCTMTANLLTAGPAAWVGTSSLALKVCSQATPLAEVQISCVITELE